MTELRPYQHNVIADYEAEIAAGKRRIILVAPTGSGKTIIGAEIIKRTIAAHKTVLVLAHRREIVNPTTAKLTANGAPHGIIQAGEEDKLRPMAAVQIASIQTLHARAMRTETIKLPPADLLVIDEAHHCPAHTYLKIIKSYPDATLL